MSPVCKAGRFVGELAAMQLVVLADNATFSLAASRMATFQSHSADRPLITSATIALPVEHLPQKLKVVGSSPSQARIYLLVCAYFGICGWNGIRGSSNEAQPYMFVRGYTHIILGMFLGILPINKKFVIRDVGNIIKNLCFQF